MIHSCIKPVEDSQPPCEQAGFRLGLCNTILRTENSFQERDKAGVDLDLTAAYDSVAPRSPPEAAEENSGLTHGKIHPGFATQTSTVG